MGPIVLVLSYGCVKPIEIIKKLSHTKIKATSSTTTTPTTTNLQPTSDLLIDEQKYPTYDYKIKNKYFEIITKLLPYDEPINTLPKELLKRTEALIVSFDAGDKSFLTHVPKLCKLAEDNNIELGLLITKQLFDDCNEALCYGDVKDICKHTFDVIETLNQSDDDEEDKQDDNKEIVEDYKEIIEALDNHVWANVASSSGVGVGVGSSVGGSAQNKQQQQQTKTTDAAAAADGNDELDEAQFEAYEALLTNIVNFKNNSANLNRDQMLDEAEKLAVLFADFMGEE